MNSVALYSDDQGRMMLLAPVGWDCSANYGADGSGGVTVYPPGGSADLGPGTQGLAGSETSACVGCTLSQACPLFPAAALKYAAEYPAQTCPARPAAESEDQLSPDVVAFSDPPGIPGSADPSGGQFTANAVMTYSTATTDGSWLDTCTLPTSDRPVCTAALNLFVADYGTR